MGSRKELSREELIGLFHECILDYIEPKEVYTVLDISNAFRKFSRDMKEEYHFIGGTRPTKEERKQFKNIYAVKRKDKQT